jgi:hypothetical protein
MANSFIEMEIEFTLRLTGTYTRETDPKTRTGIPTAYGFGDGNVGTVSTFNKYRTLFIGWKNSIEALARYDIIVDGAKLYQQSWVGEESFIYNAGMSESVRRRNPWSFTSWENVKNMDDSVCGVYVTLDNVEDIVGPYDIKVQIPIKINLHQFLVLSSVRYLPSFCGRWEIELYPAWQNLVVATVPPTETLWRNITINNDGPIYGSIDNCPEWKQKITNGFTQIGTTFKTLDRIDMKYTPITSTLDTSTPKKYVIDGTRFSAYPICSGVYGMDLKVEGIEGICQKCLCSTTTFQLRYEVYEQLRNMYSENMLVIPTNILQYGRFSGYPSGMTDGTPYHATLSQNLENCDSIFILIPFTHGQHTCFYQPFLRQVRLSLGEFGIHPQQPVRTWDDPRFVAMIVDALNLEASEITGMNDDILRTFIDRRQGYHLVKDGTTNKWDVTPEELKEDIGDQSNFFLGFSLSQIGFQSGTVTSPNSNVPFMFDALQIGRAHV